MLYIWYNDGNSTQWVVADNIAGAYLPIGGGTLTGPLTVTALTSTGAVNLNGTPNNIKGVTNNSVASAGLVGEIVSAVVTWPGTAVVSNTPLALTSISLTAGDWDIFGAVVTSISVGASAFQAGASTVQTTLPGGFSQANICMTSAYIANGTQLALPLITMQLSATTTVWLNVFGTFPSGTMSIGGTLLARRMR
jgi:hypothetical protein